MESHPSHSERETISVWIVVGTLTPGLRSIIDIANNLDHNRFDVTVWTVLSHAPSAPELDESVSYRSLDAGGKFDVGASLRFAYLVWKEKPDILQSYVFFTNILCRIGALACRETCAVSGVVSVRRSESYHRSLIDKITLPLADHIVSNSEAGKEFIIERGKCSDDVTVIWNARDTGVYNTATAPAQLRKELGIPETAPVIGIVARLIETKGHHDLLDAWPVVRSEHPDAYLLIVGDGPQRKALHKRTSHLEGKSSVIFTGERTDIPELLDIMDIFAFPSSKEGLPGALIEAMAAELPIIATAIDGNKELITDGENGLYIPTGNAEKLARSILLLLDKPSLAHSLARNARKRAEADFSIESCNKKYMRLYESLPKRH